MSATGLAAVRERIRLTMAGVAGIGQVHKRVRAILDEAAVNSLALQGGRINVWFITLADGDPYITVNSKGEPGRNPANHELADYAFVIHGWYAADDADNSEEAFTNLVEAVIAAFRADKKLGNTVIDSGPLQWAEGGYRLMPPKEGGATCHYARLNLRVREQTEP
jgi:hypothetical protein